MVVPAHFLSFGYEKAFEIDFNHESQQDMARLKEECLACSTKLKASERAFVVFSAVPKNLIGQWHRPAFANDTAHPS